MAAHVVTALNNEYGDIRDNKVSFESLQAALDFSCWTELLDIEHYRELQRIVSLKSTDALKTFINLLLPIYTAKWRDLGYPDTLEEWVNKEYNKMVKGDK